MVIYILKSGYIDIDVCHPIEENGLGEEDSSPMPSTHSKFCYVSLHSREDKRNGTHWRVSISTYALAQHT